MIISTTMILSDTILDRISVSVSDKYHLIEMMRIIETDEYDLYKTFYL